MSDVTFDLKTNQIHYHEQKAEPWRVTLIDTGETLDDRRAPAAGCVIILKDEEAFCFTYGDGVSDVDISALIAFHKSQGKLATITAVQPPGRYGALKMKGEQCRRLHGETARAMAGCINGGFFVLSPKVIDLIEGDGTPWESSAAGTARRIRPARGLPA